AFGSNNAAGSGNQGGTPDVSIAVTTGTNSVSSVNFGIEQLPSTLTKSVSICANATVQSPSLKGSDPEDGNYGQGSNNRFLIRSIPSNANLYYNGTLITAGMVSGNGYLIANFDSTLLTVTPSFSGTGTLSYTYAACDAA